MANPSCHCRRDIRRLNRVVGSRGGGRKEIAALTPTIESVTPEAVSSHLERVSVFIDQGYAGSQELERLLIDNDGTAGVLGKIAEKIYQVVNEGPDSTAAERDQFHDAQPDLAPIEAVNPERTQVRGKKHQYVLALSRDAN